MNDRVKDTTVCIPVIVGSIAFYLGKKTDDYATHRWTLYVRGPNDEDLGALISKVEFLLHHSFNVPKREIFTAPFEVTEVGWGEFEAIIRLHFKDPNETPLDLYHQVKLYPPGPSQPLSTKKPVVSETYDEIIFSDPKEFFLRCLMNYGPSGSVTARPSVLPAEYCTVFDDERDIITLTAIRDHLQRETELAKQRLIQIESEVAHLIDLNLVSKTLPLSAAAVHLAHHLQPTTSNLTKLISNSKKEYQMQMQQKTLELQKEIYQQQQAERLRLGLPPLPPMPDLTSKPLESAMDAGDLGAGNGDAGDNSLEILDGTDDLNRSGDSANDTKGFFGGSNYDSSGQNYNQMANNGNSSSSSDYNDSNTMEV